MKGVAFEYEGSKFRLALTAGALFDIYDELGFNSNILSFIDPPDADGWRNSCKMIEILSRYGEAQRKYLRQKSLPSLDASYILATAAPTDVRVIKDAIRAACSVGFRRDIEEPTMEVDLVLQELEEKKTEPSSGAGVLTTLREFLASRLRRST